MQIILVSRHLKAARTHHYAPAMWFCMLWSSWRTGFHLGPFSWLSVPCACRLEDLVKIAVAAERKPAITSTTI